MASICELAGNYEWNVKAKCDLTEYALVHESGAYNFRRPRICHYMEPKILAYNGNICCMSYIKDNLFLSLSGIL